MDHGAARRVLHKHGLFRHAHGFVADALQVHHHAQGADHKAQIAGHGLGAGQQLQGHFINFVFQGIDGRVVFHNCRGPARVVGGQGFARFFQRDAHAGGHDQQTGAQSGEQLLQVVDFLLHKRIPPSNRSGR